MPTDVRRADREARRKLFLGPQVRKMRREFGLTQAQMAAELGISASYLTLIERNQRPLTAPMILRLAETYDIDLRRLAPAADAGLLASLEEAMADSRVAGADVAPSELREVAELYPRFADALVRLHEGLAQAREDAASLAEHASQSATLAAGSGNVAVEEARQVLQARDNHYPELEAIAADVTAKAALRTDLPQALTTGLVEYLTRAHGIEVQIVPFDVMRGYLRRYDRHRRRLMLSELLAPAGRTFQVALQVGQAEAGEATAAMAEDQRLTTESSRGIYRLNLANYLGAAIMLPYERFHEAAERLRYDVEVLGSRFGASFEQVAHRLTTLRRPSARGVPFFLIRVDRAGNISKRFGGGVFPFARSGGTCPRWRLYEAFRTPGRIVVDAAALPDGQAFLTIARTVERPGLGQGMPGQDLVVGLGTEASHAHRLVYADGLSIGTNRAQGTDDEAGLALTPIGINCRLCPREACNWRAFPPLTGRLSVDVTRRSVTPYRIGD